ncbi:MAG: acyl-CoA thioesterase [Chitinophagaceae bacterium]|nr:acyl-CoA thioesterase [Chitinophagaceae bacterium]
MSVFHIPVQLRWSDFDPNFHVRHSVYYEWGAMCRMEFLSSIGITSLLMAKKQTGVVLFREECSIKKEIRYTDSLLINLSLLKSRKDFSRWIIRHEILKDRETLCAVLTVEGAWLHTVERKLTIPPPEIQEPLSQAFQNTEVEWEENFKNE